jgi:hypothetical protein
MSMRDLNPQWEWKRNEVKRQLELQSQAEPPEEESRPEDHEKPDQQRQRDDQETEEEDQSEGWQIARSLVEQMFNDAMTLAATRLERIKTDLKEGVNAMGHHVELQDQWTHVNIQTFAELEQWVEDQGVMPDTWYAWGKNVKVESDPLPFSIHISPKGHGGGGCEMIEVQIGNGIQEMRHRSLKERRWER